MADEPVQRIVDLLSRSGYRALASPLRVGGSVDFDFAAVLIGEDSLDLIVVIDTVLQSDSELTRRQIEGLGRALDLYASRRPLTTILVGPSPNEAILGSLSKVARVLPVGTPVGAEAGGQLADSLAVLLPLDLPPVAQQAADSWSSYSDGLVTENADHPPHLILAAAADGPKAVERALAAWLAEPFNREETDK